MPRSLPTRRKWFFRLAALGLPVLVFGLLELGLRLFGFGSPASFFVKNPVAGQNTVVENRQFSRRYFTRELMRIPKPLAFSPAKPPQTLRLFVFGESAAEGDPEPAFGFARILQVLLREQYPERNIEIINTAVTAINSHVIRPIAREAAAYDGDMWIVYMGNNEVVGPFGSGTVFGPQAPSLPLIRANLVLKATRSGQLLDEALESFGLRGTPREWEGMEMFLKQQVRQDDPRMATVYSHFEKNLSDIVAAGVRSGAQVVVSTVGSNLRDCPPLASLHRANLPAEKAAQWENAYQAGAALESERKYLEALAQYQRAVAVDDQFADLHFRLARCCAALEQREEARRHFALARDLDTLRFRADSRINEIIRRVAGDWQGRGTRLVDVEAALARETPDGIPGGEWFYEHVHFTFPGNYLVARQMAEQVLRCVPTAAPARAGDGGQPFLSLEECAQRLGLTDCERLRMAEEMSRRTRRPPFTHQLEHAAEVARREKILSELRAQERTNFTSSAAIYESALARAGDDWQLHDNFAGAAIQHGDNPNALAHWRRVAQLLPHRLQTYDLLGSVLLEQGKLDEAETCYEQALRIQPDYVDGLVGLGRVSLGQNRGPQAVPYFRQAVKLQPESARIRNHLGLALHQIGKSAEAEKVFRAALRVAPDFLPARLNLSSALLAQGNAGDALTNYEALVRGDPSNATIRVALGKAFAKQGRTKEAIRQYAQAVRQQPDDFDARDALANALIRVNRLAEAAEQIAAAIRLRPGSAESRLNYGSILASQQKTAEARAQFEESLRLKPDFAPAHLNLAMILTEQNQLPQAIAHLQEVLRLDPGNDRARRLLDAALARRKAGQ